MQRDGSMMQGTTEMTASPALIEAVYLGLGIGLV